MKQEKDWIDRAITVEEAADRLGCSPRNVTALIKRRRLRAKMVEFTVAVRRTRYAVDPASVDGFRIERAKRQWRQPVS